MHKPVDYAQIERECRDSWTGITPEQIRAKIRALDGHPMRALLGRVLAGAIAKYAPRHLGLLEPEWVKAHQELPEIVAKSKPSLRQAALEIRPEIRKGPPL